MNETDRSQIGGFVSAEPVVSRRTAAATNASGGVSRRYRVVLHVKNRAGGVAVIVLPRDACTHDRSIADEYFLNESLNKY